MEFAKHEIHRNAMAAACARGATHVVSFAWTTLRLTLYSVLAVLEPVIVWILSALTLIGLGTCLFQLAARSPHFPMVLMLMLSAACALALVFYYAFMELLLPE